MLTVGNKCDRKEYRVSGPHDKTDSFCTCSSRQVAGDSSRTIRHC